MARLRMEAMAIVIAIGTLHFVDANGPAYHKKPRWEECKANEVIYSEDICRVAADTLDLNYGGEKWESSTPKGCYWEYYNGNIISAYYNVGKGSSYIYDPYTTFEDSHHNWAQRGGICFSKECVDCSSDCNKRVTTGDWKCSDSWVKENCKWSCNLCNEELVHTEKGVTCSDSGFINLVTEQECFDAVTYAKSFNSKMEYLGAKSFDSRPSGCFFILDYGIMYWNTNLRGQESFSCTSICRGG